MNRLFCILVTLLVFSCEKKPLPPAELGEPDDAAPALVSSQSYFIVNEDRFGQQNGTLNRLWFDGHITYRAYRKANPGSELGITAQYATIYGDNMYLVSKQGLRLVVADARTLKRKAEFRSLGDGDNDGRACVGVDAETMYVSSQDGIRIFDIPSLRFTGSVEGIGTGQVGDMVRVGNRVFAAMQGRGILVIDTRSHSLDTLIEPQSTGGLCLSRNGWLWVSGHSLKAFDPYTLVLQAEVLLSAGHKGGGVDWGTWRSCSLCASTKRNTIYWMEHNNSPSGDVNQRVFKYDIDQSLLSSIKDLTTYGVIRVDPLRDAITTVDGTMFDDQGNLLRSFSILGGTPSFDGSVDESKPYLYWFSTLPVFEDVNSPAILRNEIVVTRGETRSISLSSLLVDHDNVAQSIQKKLTFESNTLLQHDVRNDTLRLYGLGLGETSVLMRVNSNGIITEKRIRIRVV